MTARASEKLAPRFRFASKAATLEQLAARVTKGRLCDQVVVKATTWPSYRDSIVEEVIARFPDATLVVRSSAVAEDSWDNSLAGAHLSIVSVRPAVADVADAIDRVFASYSELSPGDEVLIQPMVEDIALSGVVLTRDLDTGSPYYVINYDDFSGRTDTVTAGAVSKTVLVHRSRTGALRSARLRKLVDCAIELESVTGSHELDIEFCITGAEEVYVLQVRPLAARRRWTPVADATVDAAIDDIRVAVAGMIGPESGLVGKTTILSEMTDWNPAEMIGATPRPLALSLYKTLITDRVWAEARARMGYRAVAGPLLVDFRGRPYIDVRRSLNSFLPAGLDDVFAGRWIDRQLDSLAENPGLHDKVEFEIAVTCRDFAFAEARADLAATGFERGGIDGLESALAAVTERALNQGCQHLAGLLGNARRLLTPAGKNARPATPAAARRLLDDCRRLGIAPFAELARHAFIGVSFLKSLVRRGVFDADDVEDFLHGINTVATDLVGDMRAVAAGTRSGRDFLERYGHLRPGTYDVLSWRYDERPDLYLGHVVDRPQQPRRSFALSPAKKAGIGKLLVELGYDVTADGLLAYVVQAVTAREEAKFAFSRSISDALAGLCAWAEGIGLTRDDLSFLPIEALADDADVGALMETVARNREAFTVTRAIRLPHLISDPADIDVVRLPLGHPTFITGKAVTGRTRYLRAVKASDIDGFIVLIESADPGFDWIFSHDILGLVTMYGGANSHMAIRCAEFALPAAIGCGERLFETLAKAPVIELNCAARKVGGQ